MSSVLLANVTKSFADASPGGQRLPVLDSLSFEVADGAFVAIFGPNASGKSTLLNAIAGLIELDDGSIEIDGVVPGLETIGYIFQDYRETLLPWLTVADNITFPLSLRHIKRQVRDAKAERLLENLRIELPLSRWPWQLSGGQQQLIVVARALISEPHLLLFDEPFNALDLESRLWMRDKLQSIWSLSKTTTIFVSHDLDEAILMADRVVMLSRRPARVLDIIEVPLPRPRSHSLLEEEEFFSIRKRALKVFREAINQ
jgi:NitT/TauT family transport system ATP-binding protein